MNILFLAISSINSFKAHNIYSDLLCEFIKDGHTVYAVTAAQKRTGIETRHIVEDGSHMLRVMTGNLTECSMIEKGMSMLRIGSQFKKAINGYFPGVKFDLILYATPPITLVGVVKSIKKRDKAKTYLLLKDIFPQNAVDIGMMSQKGVKGLIYRYFRKKEKRLYAISDAIGCMSPANVSYVLRHNPEVSAGKTEVCPNSKDIYDVFLSEEEKTEIRRKYELPIDRKIFLYGGNLGKPQSIPFIIDCIRLCKNKNALFLIVGSGTDSSKIRSFIADEHPDNLIMIDKLPREDFEKLSFACSVGLIFLDHRFTIPNFPSRLLSYLQAKLPVAAFTDANTDLGKIIEEGRFGWFAESDNAERAAKLLDTIADMNDLDTYGENGYRYMCNNYDSADAYRTIIKTYSRLCSE